MQSSIELGDRQACAWYLGAGFALGFLVVDELKHIMTCHHCHVCLRRTPSVITRSGVCRSFSGLLIGRRLLRLCVGGERQRLSCVLVARFQGPVPGACSGIQVCSVAQEHWQAGPIERQNKCETHLRVAGERPAPTKPCQALWMPVWHKRSIILWVENMEWPCS